MEHEADTRPQWAERPRIGDLVANVRNPEIVGEVIATFYGNGEGGMHVRFPAPYGCSWASCHTAKVVERRTPVENPGAPAVIGA